MKGPNHTNMIAGKPVINAKKSVTLHISAADVKKGASKDPGGCAAALAAVREVPNCVQARVHLGRTYLLATDGKWRRFKTPEALRGEIIAFDRGGKFEPGEYELRPMSPSDLNPKPRNFERSDTNRSLPKPNHLKRPRKLHVVRGVRQRGANR